MKDTHLLCCTTGSQDAAVCLGVKHVASEQKTLTLCRLYLWFVVTQVHLFLCAPSTKKIEQNSILFYVNCALVSLSVATSLHIFLQKQEEYLKFFFVRFQN